LGLLWSFSPDSVSSTSEQHFDVRDSPCLDGRDRMAIISSRLCLLICFPLLHFFHSAIVDEGYQQKHIEQRSEDSQNQCCSCWNHSCHVLRRRALVEPALNIHFRQMIGSTEKMNCQHITLVGDDPDQKPFGDGLSRNHDVGLEHPRFDLSSIDAQPSLLNRA
jgi:hypothetical protein